VFSMKGIVMSNLLKVIVQLLLVPAGSAPRGQHDDNVCGS